MWFHFNLIIFVVDGVLSTDRINKNISAAVNSTLTLTCTSNTSKKIRWHYYKTPTSFADRIYNGETIDSRFENRFKVSNTSYGKLEIHYAHINDSGTYECLELKSSEQSIRFYVTVGEQTVPHLDLHNELIFQALTSTIVGWHLIYFSS